MKYFNGKLSAPKCTQILVITFKCLSISGSSIWSRCHSVASHESSVGVESAVVSIMGKIGNLLIWECRAKVLPPNNYAHLSPN